MKCLPEKKDFPLCVVDFPDGIDYTQSQKEEQTMNQIKTGAFLKRLRQEKNITQEQLAEKFSVSGRTVSRWETGSNLPDLAILIELADFYAVDIREIIDGERKRETMDDETKETLLKVAEYSEEEKNRMKKKMLHMSEVSALLLFLYVFLEGSDVLRFLPIAPRDFLQGAILGLALGVLVLNAIYLSGGLDRIRQWKLHLFQKK